MKIALVVDRAGGLDRYRGGVALVEAAGIEAAVARRGGVRRAVLVDEGDRVAGGNGDRGRLEGEAADGDRVVGGKRRAGRQHGEAGKSGGEGGNAACHGVVSCCGGGETTAETGEGAIGETGAGGGCPDGPADACRRAFAPVLPVGRRISDM